MSAIASLNVEASLRGLPANPLAYALLEKLILSLPGAPGGARVRSALRGRDDGGPVWAGDNQLVITRPGSDVVLNAHHDAIVRTLPNTTLTLADRRNGLGGLVHYDVVVGDGSNSITLNRAGSDVASTFGNDLIRSRGGPDTITGGQGHDTIIAGGQSSVTGGGRGDLIDAGLAPGSRDTVSGGVRSDIVLSHGDNVVYGAGHGDTVRAGAGRDTVYGYAGNSPETIEGGGHTTIFAGRHDRIRATGSDTIYGGGASDTVYSADGGQFIRGGAGRLHVQVAANANDTIFGGSVHDEVRVAQSARDLDRTLTTHNPDGSTTLHFLNGQSLSLKDVRLSFDHHRHQPGSAPAIPLDKPS